MFVTHFQIRMGICALCSGKLTFEANSTYCERCYRKVISQLLSIEQYRIFCITSFLHNRKGTIENGFWPNRFRFTYGAICLYRHFSTDKKTIMRETIHFCRRNKLSLDKHTNAVRSEYCWWSLKFKQTGNQYS